MFDGLQQRHNDSVSVGVGVVSNSSKLTVNLQELSIYILKYVVAAVVGCDVWEEVVSPEHAS